MPPGPTGTRWLLHVRSASPRGGRKPCPPRTVSEGGTAYVLHEGWLIEREGASACRLVQEASLPITLGGAASFQTANILAALAACRAMGQSREQVVDALLTFQSDRDNLGRMNLYRVERGYVLVDYGHNLGAFEAIRQWTAACPERRVTGVLTVP